MTIIVPVFFFLLSVVGIGGLVATNNWAWLGASIPLVFMIIFVAPYVKWKDQKDKADNLENEMKPKIKVIGIMVQNRKGGQAYQVEIANLGKEDIKRCHGRLTKLEFETPQGSKSLSGWPVNQDLHWGGQVENAEYYDIPGNLAAKLNVAYCSPIDGKPSVRLAYRSTEEFRKNNALPQKFGPIIATIRISYERGSPIDLMFRINPTIMVDTILKAYEDTKPFELLQVIPDEYAEVP